MDNLPLQGQEKRIPTKAFQLGWSKLGTGGEGGDASNFPHLVALPSLGGLAQHGLVRTRIIGAHLQVTCIARY